jgi:dihydroorotase
METLIAGARLLCPATGLDRTGDLLVRDGCIAAIGSLDRPGGAALVEAAGAILCPGLIDLRGSFDEADVPAAHAGGIVTVAALPPVTEPAMARWLRLRGDALGLTVLPYGAATDGDGLAEYGLLREAGAVAFCDGGRAIASARLMRAALLYARGFASLLTVHPEEPSLAAGGVATEGERATRMGLPGIPAAAEAIQVARDLALARLTGGRLHIAHVSTAGALALIRAAKAERLPVTCDTAPPYFDLNETAIGDWRTYAKLSPPLRAEADRQAVAAALADGTIDAIASDHTPRDADAKRLPFEQAAAGGAGWATLLGVTLAQVHGGTLSMGQAVALLTHRPATVLGIAGGTLAMGAPADLCLFDPDRAWQVTAGRLPGRAQNTPFDGRALEGVVLGTWRHGERVYDAAERRLAWA